MTDDRTPPSPGAYVLPGYTVKERLGRTGYGLLLRARQNALNRDVLIKLVPASASEIVEAVRAEAKLRVELGRGTI